LSRGWTRCTGAAPRRALNDHLAALGRASRRRAHGGTPSGGIRIRRLQTLS
jgi:hypothetical protein